MMIRVGFVFDELGNPEKEQAEAIMELNEMGLTDIEVVLTDSNMFKMRDISLDLLIIDYGGMATLPGGNASANMQIWSACNYAEEHPGTLLILWTAFTRVLYEKELMEQFGSLDNITYHYASNVYEDLSCDQLQSKLSAWFGIQALKDGE